MLFLLRPLPSDPLRLNSLTFRVSFFPGLSLLFHSLPFEPFLFSFLAAYGVDGIFETTG